MMILPKKQKNLAKQKGTVLAIALVILILVTLIGVNGMYTGTQEMRMSLNEEQRTLSFQTTQAMLEETTGPKHEAEIYVCGKPGDKVISSVNSSSCSGKQLTLNDVPIGTDDSYTIQVTRLSPEVGAPPRIAGQETSASKFQAAYFQAEATHNTPGSRSGYTNMTQGYAVIITKE